VGSVAALVVVDDMAAVLLHMLVSEVVGMVELEVFVRAAALAAAGTALALTGPITNGMSPKHAAVDQGGSCPAQRRARSDRCKVNSS